jgi:tetratricopeptide (TPR) repeat protein
MNKTRAIVMGVTQKLNKPLAECVGPLRRRAAKLPHALEIARSIDPAPIRLISELARKLGRLHEHKGDYAEAMCWLDTALEELSRDPDSTRSVEMVRLHLERGWVYYRRGDLDKAQQARLQVLALSEGTDYYMEMGSAYNGLVPLFWAKGDWANALAYGEKGLALRKKIGDMEGAARSYLNLGTIAGLRGEWQKAIEYNERALSQARRIQLTSTITTTLNNLGYMHTVRGQTPLARANLQEALRISEQSGDVHQSCVTLNNLVRAATLEQNLQEAQTALARSLKLATETGNKSDLAETHWLITEAHWQNNDLAAAYQAAQQALTIAEKAQLKLYEGRACRVLGHVLCAQHDLNQAETLLTRAGDIFAQLNNRYEIAHNHRAVARLRFLQSNHGAANREAQLALATFGDLGAEADQQHTPTLLQDIRHAQT